MRRFFLVAVLVSVGIAVGLGTGGFVGGRLEPNKAWRPDPTTPEFLPPDDEELERRRWLCAVSGAVLGGAAGLIAYDAVTRRQRRHASRRLSITSEGIRISQS